MFANGLSVNIKFSKTQLAKMLQSGRILGELLVALPYTALEAGTQELIIEGSGVTLTNNKIKDNMKVISL